MGHLADPVLFEPVPKTSKTEASFSQYSKRIVALVVLANLFTFLTIAISLTSSYHLYSERAAAMSRNTDTLVSQSISSEIDRIDFGLQTVVDEFYRMQAVKSQDYQGMNIFLNRQLDRLPMVYALGVTDASGKILVFSAGGPKSANLSVADRDYFKAMHSNPGQNIVISSPVIGQVSGKWVLVFARSLRHAEQGFDGIVLATVSLEWFDSKLNDLKVGSHGTVVLRGDASRNFDLLARFPQKAEFVGQTAVSDIFRSTITANPQSGSYEAYAGGDHVHRIFSYSAVGSYPLITLVGLATDDIYAEWWNEFFKLMSLGLAFCLFSGFGGRAILRALRAKMDAQQHAQFLSFHDPLTHLPNRVLAQDRFLKSIAYADREKSMIAMLLLDLDNFKTINDSLGHAVGDGLIREVSLRLLKSVRNTDTVSRQGGDEFLIILNDVSQIDSIAPFLVKIMDAVHEPFEFASSTLHTSVSVGVALYPDDGSDFETLLKKADTAMYWAKDAGRNAYRFFDEKMNIEAIEKFRMHLGLRTAISQGQFVLHYQPQIDLKSGMVVGAEALIRWNHPEMGLLPPSSFIAIAEDSGLIVPIGDWVLHEACRQAEAWKRAGHPNLVMAVNLSAVQFKRSDIQQTVQNVLEETSYDPTFLELELTESLLLENMENVLSTVKNLKAIGVKFSIDDFGTGYSSFSYLKRLEINKLKIDQSFIRDLPRAPDDQAIVRAIIQMGQSLSLRVIAEGVEDEAVLTALQDLQCNEAQGYFFARPLPADEFVHFLQRHSADLIGK